MAEEIDEIKEKVRKGLEQARWGLLNKFPFTGEMLLRFSIVPTYDCRLETAATDGNKIYFDCEFYSQLTSGQREFVLAHEVWHNIFLHFTRQCGRDTQLWNVATDMEINHMLQNEGLEVLKDGCFPDPIVAGKNAEDIYAYLMKQEQKKNNQKNNQNNQGGNSKGGHGQGNGQGSSQNDDGDGNDQQNSDKNGNSGNNKTKNGNQFDKHIYEGDDAGQGEEKDGKWGKKGFDKDFNPSMGNASEVEEKIKDAVCSVAQSIERKQGHLPAGVKSIVDTLLKPEINWKEQLSQFTSKCLGGERSWKRISRHALTRGHYLPGRMDETINIGLVLDTSGSYLGDLPKFLAELDGLLRSFGKFKITLIQCDAEVQSVKEYDDSNPIDVSKFEVCGGGGSDFCPAFKYIREHGEDEFNAVISFTDGYIDVPKYAPPYPVLFVLPSDGNKDFCEWGEKMVFKPENKE